MSLIILMTVKNTLISEMHFSSQNICKSNKYVGVTSCSLFTSNSTNHTGSVIYKCVRIEELILHTADHSSCFSINRCFRSKLERQTTLTQGPFKFIDYIFCEAFIIMLSHSFLNISIKFWNNSIGRVIVLKKIYYFNKLAKYLIYY